MSDYQEMLASLLVFKNGGEGDQEVEDSVIVQITEAYVDGRVELAFTMPKTNRRVYLTVPLMTLVHGWGLYGSEKGQ